MNIIQYLQDLANQQAVRSGLFFVLIINQEGLNSGT
jgi:hypothetical protein